MIQKNGVKLSKTERKIVYTYDTISQKIHELFDIDNGIEALLYSP